MRSKTISLADSDAAVARVTASAFRIPTERPESDGTFEWAATTMVVAEVEAAGACGLGYSYTSAAAVPLIEETLAETIRGAPAMDISRAWVAMQRAVRNLGRPGLSATAISAVDAALWDLKGRLLNLPLLTLLGAVRNRCPVYGSGGFTSYPLPVLADQLAGWADAGITRVKMKVGRDADADVARVEAAREVIGPQAELFVDANGAWTPARAIAMASRFAPSAVSWLEEPVSSDDLVGLAAVRGRVPPGVEVAAGEYAYDVWYCRRMLEAGAVDVLQADATRCGGLTGFLQIGALCDAFMTPLSAHTAPSLHAAVCCAISRIRHIEYFVDHVRIEQMLFDGAPVPRRGQLAPDPATPGLGLEFKRADAARYRVA
jgi:L-alanine-DL-glutamate epimerase-like enolase superfamily enzyme